MKKLLIILFFLLLSCFVPPQTSAQSCNGGHSYTETFADCVYSPVTNRYSCDRRTANSYEPCDWTGNSCRATFQASEQDCVITNGGLSCSKSSFLDDRTTTSGCSVSNPNPTAPPNSTPPPSGGSCAWCAGSNQCPSGWNFSANHPACGGLGCCTDPGAGSNPGGGGGGGGGGYEVSCRLDWVTENPSPIYIGVNNETMRARWHRGAGQVHSVAVRNSNSAVLGISRSDQDIPDDDSDTFITLRFTGRAVGQSRVKLEGYGQGRTTCPIGTDQGDCEQENACDSSERTITVLPPLPWWQAVNASVVAGGNLISTIPTSVCTAPSCNPYLIYATTGNTAGTAIYGVSPNTYDFSAEDGQGRASTPGWVAQTSTSTDLYNFVNVDSLTGDNVTYSTVSSNLNAPAVDSEGVVWYRVTGDYAINSPQTITKKVVLLVRGSLTINSSITVSPGGFFMAATSGNITVASSVGNTAVGTPNLSGIYLSNGMFSTGTGNLPLQIKGSVVALGGYDLARDLGNGNLSRPAETFIYDPSILLSFPKRLVKDKLIWREVAP